jgi:light-regulated signal transduction histidine kinase (bacteriophytochrome)
MTSPRDFPHALALRAETVAFQAGPVEAPPGPARRLASAEQTLHDISHALAHDLRTSLRHVSSYAQLLADPAHAGQPEQVRRLSDKVIGSTRRLQTLMDSVSALARLQVADLKPERLDTQALVRLLVQAMAHDSTGPAVTCVIAPDLPASRGDADLLRQVWFELLDNAWRHAGRHPQARIEVSHAPVPGGHAWFVQDNGPGFDPASAARLFGLFQCAQDATGPGAGLALVRRIVECHGGRVWATAQPGEGARFGFSLPADAG